MSYDELPATSAPPSDTHLLAPQCLKTRVAMLLLAAITAASLAQALLISQQDWLHRQGFDVPAWLDASPAFVQASLTLTLACWVLWFLVVQRRLIKASARYQQLQVRESLLRRRMQRLLDASPTVIYAHEDPKSLASCSFISNSIEKVTGYTAEQALADAGFWQDHLHPDDRERIMSSLDRLLAEGELDIDYRFRKASGGYCWIHDTAKVIREPAGGIEAIVGSWSDITHAKLYEQDLLRLRQATEASVDMIFMTDAEGFIEYANPSFCRFTGWRPDEIVGRSTRILDSGKTPAAVFKNLWKTLARGESWSGRLLNRRKGLPHLLVAGQTDPPDPLNYWAEVSITPILDDQGTNLGFVSIQRDISTLAAEEDRLAMEREDTAARLGIANILHRQSPLEARFAAVLDTLFSLRGLAIQKKGGVFLRREGSETLDMFVLRGSFSEEFIRRERQIPLGACLCGRAAVSGKLLVSDDCFCDPRHEHQFENMANHGHYIIPLRGNGCVLGILFLYTDPYPAHEQARMDMLMQVGEMMALAIQQAKAERALEEARDAARESSRLKSDFLANMSHEIRTPMNGVLGMLELLETTALTAEQKEFAETAHHSAEALLYIINDILDFSKIEAGKLELESIDFDVRQLTEEVCALLAGRAHAKGLEFTCFVAPGLPGKLRGDPTRLRQVLTNLIGNAIKFTEHGEVSVEAVCLGEDDGQARLRFKVKDSGIGIGPQTQSRLFQPFIQANGATTRQFGGTGLGLAISKDLIQRMGGEIGLESAVGEGSTFWFTATLDKQPIAEAFDPAADLERRKVLVVDDNATNRRILDCFLNNWGADPVLAENAPVALELLRSADAQGKAFDLAILDLQMPGMDGLELARQMQTDTALRNVPRIMLSSGGLGSEEDCRMAGIAKMLNKPVRQSYLYDAIIATLNEAPSVLPATVEPKEDEALPDYAGHRILLVEDNATNQKVALRMLARFGLVAELATDGRQALAALERERFDLIFMDCQMPNMDGYEATRRWRVRETERKLPRSPVIALTANAMQTDRETCLTAGMDGHLAKPFNSKKLSGILAQWLGKAVQEPAPTALQAAIWDPDQALLELDGDLALFEELTQLLIDGEAPLQLERLRESAEQNDPSAFARTAHTLNGIAGPFCAKQLQEVASRLEREARQGGDLPLKAMADELALAVDRLCEEASRR